MPYLFVSARFGICTAHFLNDIHSREIPNFTNQEVADMLTEVIQISNSTGEQRLFRDERDLKSPHLLYRHALLAGYSYCEAKEDIPTNGLLPNIINDVLPTGRFLVVRDPNHEMPEYQISVNHDDKTIVLTFRGSLTREDWMLNNDDTLVGAEDSTFTEFNSFMENAPTCSLGNDAKAFEGFLRSLSDDNEKLATGLAIYKMAYSDYSFIIVGHSLGGAKAMLFAYYVSNFLPEKLPVAAVYTFGQPILGNKAFTNGIADCIGKEKIIRAATERDTVVWLRRKKDEIDHPDNVALLYSANHSDFNFKTCFGPNDPLCGSDTTCTKLTTHYHGWFAGLYFSGSQFCRSLSTI